MDALSSSLPIKRVLLVEDDATYAELVGLLLRDVELVVVQTSRRAEALLLEAWDLIVLDHGLTRSSKTGLSLALEARRAGVVAPILLNSDALDERTRVLAKAAGVSTRMKGVDLNGLRAALSSYLGARYVRDTGMTRAPWCELSETLVGVVIQAGARLRLSPAMLDVVAAHCVRATRSDVRETLGLSTSAYNSRWKSIVERGGKSPAILAIELHLEAVAWLESKLDGATASARSGVRPKVSEVGS